MGWGEVKVHIELHYYIIYDKILIMFGSYMVEFEDFGLDWMIRLRHAYKCMRRHVFECRFVIGLGLSVEMSATFWVFDLICFGGFLI